MFKIGEFSKISQVSVKTLRWYDEVGLLKPAEVDDFTGYRYYSAGQMATLSRILVFKDLGFTLTQIADLLNEKLSTERMQGMLRLRKMQIEQNLSEEQERLARVAARLRLIEQEETMSEHEVVLKKVEPLTVASARTIVPTWADMQEYCTALVGDITGWLSRHGLSPSSPWLSISKDTEYIPRDIGVEMAVGVDAPAGTTAKTEANETVTLQTLPAQTVASTVHSGSYDTLWQAYTALAKWTETNGYRFAGGSRIVFLEGGSDPSNPGYVSEVQYPVEKA